MLIIFIIWAIKLLSCSGLAPPAGAGPPAGAVVEVVVVVLDSVDSVVALVVVSVVGVVPAVLAVLPPRLGGKDMPGVILRAMRGVISLDKKVMVEM